MKALKDRASGKDNEAKPDELFEKITPEIDAMDEKVLAFRKEFEETLTKISGTTDNLTQQIHADIHITKETLDNVSNITRETIEQIKKVPDTNIYKMLGNLPDRVKTFYSSITADITSMSNVTKSIKAKMHAGNKEENLNEILKYYKELGILNKTIAEKMNNLQSSVMHSGIIQGTGYSQRQIKSPSNFRLEAQGAKNMADGAKRFSVAQMIEVGTKNGENISLVMEKANGIKLNSLPNMINLYKGNPSEYFVKYAKEIEDNVALKAPEKWINDLGVAYQKAQNEQAMFISKSGERTIHADPHSGNV